ncbi:MAG: peptidoglycan bridge formation glycyltransferase FemA/FemB family protein [Candidatus Spechtbacterales bacterium]|nr:peptidoglycan bridge formation glycyltransferase FemA/FemB family protein [Candidatus Spechtbacterales bacterium]
MFLNTKEWRAFQETAGRKTFSIAKDCYVVKMDLPLNKSYLYSPSPNSYKHIENIKEIARKENAIYFKYEPMLKKRRAKGRISELLKLGFKEAPKALQPQKTIILDLQKSKDTLLKEMHSKTRYNVRLAKRRGVFVKESSDIEKFITLLKETSNRDDFRLHPEEYYRKLFKMSEVKLFYASRKDEPWHVAALIIFDNNRITYLHGASNYKYRKHMAPHRLHWEIMQYAKNKNYKEYDLWGVDKKKWPGVTRFKKGFGGKRVEYIGSYDRPLQRLWYMVYKIKNKFWE